MGVNLKIHVPKAFLCLHALGNVGGGQGALIPCACARVCWYLYVLRASYALVQATVGVGTVIIPYIGVAYTRGGGGYLNNVVAEIRWLERLSEWSHVPHFLYVFTQYVGIVPIASVGGIHQIHFFLHFEASRIHPNSLPAKTEFFCASRRARVLQKSVPASWPAKCLNISSANTWHRTPGNNFRASITPELQN